LTKEEMQVLIEQSAKIGAKKALLDIGLSEDKDLLTDVSELRSLLDSWRSAKRTAGKTIVQALTAIFLAMLIAGAYFNFTDKQ
tara:strand:+ start:55 stop:303 length:249 start_codon:yes stop_codon:yes gene_type:complete